MNTPEKRHCITLNNKAFSRLQKEGRFGESYSNMILRILDCIAPNLDESSKSNVIKFMNRKCKQKDHKSCLESWCGLGFQIVCECTCHNRKEAEGFEGPASATVGHRELEDSKDAGR